MTAAIEYFQFVLAPQILIGLVLGVAVILVALGLTIIFGLLGYRCDRLLLHLACTLPKHYRTTL